MSLENLTGSNVFISALVPTNPEDGDSVSQGDDHIRGIKNVLHNTFPNLTGAVTVTQQQINSVAESRAGELFDFAGTTPPAYAIARPLVPTNASISTYPALFAAIGTTWGGDGITTFGLPYIAADEVDVRANGNVATVTAGQVLSHSHNIANWPTVFNEENGDGSNNVWANQRGLSAGIVQPFGGTKNLAAGVRVLKCVRIK